MNRRKFLEIATLGTSITAGCGRTQHDAPTTEGTTAQSSAATTQSTGKTPTSSTESEDYDPDTYIVAPDGAPSNPGTPEAPLGSIQSAIDVAQPGETIVVRDGTYHEALHTRRPGTADNPITITGSENAVVRGDPEEIVLFFIRHSHVHLRGLTINGLHDPSKPTDPASYIQTLIHCLPEFDTDRYLEDIVISPAGIGNARRPLMLFNRTKNLEIGPTKIIGLAGAVYVHGDAQDHTGEIVYLGTPPEIALREEPRQFYRWDGLDQSRNVHIHHIDNTAGHPHAELVNTKLGTRNVLVEYCTSLGGSQNTEPYPTAEVRFQSHDATLRWCNLQGGHGYGVHVVDHRPILERHPDASMTPAQSGTAHSIYGNVIREFGARALAITTSADEQDILCGNSVTGLIDGPALGQCHSDVPDGDGLGHNHIRRSGFPTRERVRLEFNKTLNPAEEDPDNTDDRELAFKCHAIKLVDGSDDTVLSANVGSNDLEIAYAGGVYNANSNGDESWRWLGGPERRVDIYFPTPRIEAATKLQLRGHPAGNDKSASLYRNGNLVGETAFSGSTIRTYTFPLHGT